MSEPNSLVRIELNIRFSNKINTDFADGRIKPLLSWNIGKGQQLHMSSGSCVFCLGDALGNDANNLNALVIGDAKRCEEVSVETIDPSVFASPLCCECNESVHLLSVGETGNRAVCETGRIITLVWDTNGRFRGSD